MELIDGFYRRRELDTLIYPLEKEIEAK